MGKNWAIVVGINHYENLRSLNFAKRDAAAMATWFKQEARFDQVFLFTDDSPPIATNPPIPTQPTFGLLRGFLHRQFEEIQPPLLKPEDNLWFFFAGHGNRYKDKDYLMLSDSVLGDIEYTAISVDYVTQRLRRSGAGNVVLFLDACRDESRSGLGIGEQKYQGVITFYSCTANQKSWEIDELQHGSFTYSLLEGLRLQGEANCATVERLAQYLNHQVPALNSRYCKAVQNPYWLAEPPYKMYFILLEQAAMLRDVEPLKLQAYKAEAEGDFSLAEQLWMRVLAVSGSDHDVIKAIKRVAIRQQVSFEPTIITSEPVNSYSGGQSVNSEPVTASLITSEPTEELLLTQRQEGQELIKSPIQQPSADKPTQATQELITRQKFLQWVGLGGVSLITTVIGLGISKGQSSAFGLPLWTVEFETVTVDEKGKVIKRDPHKQAKVFTEDLGNDITLEMVYIPGGAFKMGSPLFLYSNEKPQHYVYMHSFFMGRFEVTQEQYQQVMGKNPSHFKGEKRPVERVSWDDAIEFCKQLSQKTGQKYRLPSEAEWEYACCAKTTTPFHFGKTITTELANYDGTYTYASEPKGKYRQQTTEVGTFPPNGFGLYDMHGNVWEWCQDIWHYSYEGAPKDGKAWLDNNYKYRLLRGGSWLDNPEYCRSACRNANDRTERDLFHSNLGFRVACEIHLL